MADRRAENRRTLHVRRLSHQRLAALERHAPEKLPRRTDAPPRRPVRTGIALQKHGDRRLDPDRYRSQLARIDALIVNVQLSAATNDHLARTMSRQLEPHIAPVCALLEIGEHFVAMVLLREDDIEVPVRRIRVRAEHEIWPNRSDVENFDQ